MKQLLDLVYQPFSNAWPDAAKASLEGLFGAPAGRYPDAALRSAIKVRAPGFTEASAGVPFAALINASTTDSGAYGGMSFVLFPNETGPALVSMVVGTQGISPDDQVLSRPGHARKASAIAGWLNAKYGAGKQVAWAKHDPVRIDLDVPKNLKDWLGPGHGRAISRYGREIYALFLPGEDRTATEAALKAFLDLALVERNHQPLAAWRTDAGNIQSEYFSYLMPDVALPDLQVLLSERRYVILEGPPGTGKTRAALKLLDESYGGHGASIQFHPNTTYESFVGGLAPEHAADGLGLRFSPTKGHLMEAIAVALSDPRPYLLHVDEINRADLSKVLGEAIFLLEPTEAGSREISLAFDFGNPFGRQLRMPKNLHILGTMNSADRSIAILDVAIRRRFAFVKLWPQISVVTEEGGTLMQEAFRRLLDVFTDHASDDAFALVPGHSYFLEADDSRAARALKVNLEPLLQEYLAQGYVAGFSEEIRGYLQWIESLDGS